MRRYLSADALIVAMRAKCGLPDDRLRALVDGVFAAIKEAVKNGERVEIRNFGVFYAVTRKGYFKPGGFTGSMQEPPRREIRFRPSPVWMKELQERDNASGQSDT